MGNQKSTQQVTSQMDKVEEEIFQKNLNHYLEYYTNCNFYHQLMKMILNGDEEKLEKVLKYVKEENDKPIVPTKIPDNKEEFLKQLKQKEEEEKKKENEPKEETFLQKELKGISLHVFYVYLNLDALRYIHKDRLQLLLKYFEYFPYGVCIPGVQFNNQYILYWMPDNIVYLLDLNQLPEDIKQKGITVTPLKVSVCDLDLTELRNVNLVSNFDKISLAYIKERQFDAKFTNSHHFVESILRRMTLKQDAVFPGQFGTYLQRVQQFYSLVEMCILDPLNQKPCVFQSLDELQKYRADLNGRLQEKKDEFQNSAEYWLLETFEQFFNLQEEVKKYKGDHQKQK